ncbi:hypothetical protein F0562_010844 [Nyssa sinensis]|uniref:Uncharacterized protein n=1 Tax=Nyssa sinensis TaxID=561372 RepID=A0A5J5A3P8_9ASTE|nr:hypothetical protein F0562_010844 [Nyssa sinensis]
MTKVPKGAKDPYLYKRDLGVLATAGAIPLRLFITLVMASSSYAEHELTSQKRNYSGLGEEYNFPILEVMEQQQSEADVETKVELATSLSDMEFVMTEALISDDLQMYLERSPELVGPRDEKNNQMQVRESGDNGEDSDSVSLWMKPEVYRAITMGDKDRFRLEDAKHSVLDQVSPRRNTVLHVAASLGHCELVAVIVNRYPQLTRRKNSTGDLAIHLAASSGHQLMVECMVCQAKQHAGQASGSGQIDIAIEENEKIKKTASRNAQVDILMEENLEKNTALHLAMKNRHYELARFLVEKNPQGSINLNKERMSPLYMAAEAGHLELVKLMTEKRRAEMTELMRGKSLAHAAIKGRNRGKTIYTRLLGKLAES